MNKSQIIALAAGFAEDPSQTRFAGLYDGAADNAQTQFALDSKCLWKDASTITVVDGTASYNLPSDFMWEKNVTHKGIALKPISRATLEYYRKSSDWSEDDGTPKYYCIDPEEARKTILLYPNPTSADAGANLILTYYPLPATLSSDSSIPLNASLLMVQFHIGIAAYLAWLLLGNVPLTVEISAKRKDLLEQYQAKVTDAINTFGNTVSETWVMRGGRY